MTAVTMNNIETLVQMIVSLKKSTSDANEKATELAEEELIVTEPSKEKVKAQKVDGENEGKESTDEAAEVDNIDVDVETKPVN